MKCITGKDRNEDLTSACTGKTAQRLHRTGEKEHVVKSDLRVGNDGDDGSMRTDVLPTE